LQYLKEHCNGDLDFVAPPELTQDGISAALGITRPHASLVLKKLVSDGFVEARLVHIRGGRRRRTAYILSPSGYQVVRAA
jgi:DNA-binding transcriptional regulator GbsR (MarR family)